MFAGLGLQSAAVRGRSRLRCYAAHAALISIALLAQGCAADPGRVLLGADPSDPGARVASAQYRPVLGGYTAGRPVEPAPWTGRNDGAVPAPKDGR